MIFSTSDSEARPIARTLRSRAQAMEDSQPGVYVLAAREFSYPVQQQVLEIRVEQYHKMNLLEKILLQAYTELFPRPSHEELAEVLGIDPVFIKNTFQDLISMHSLVYSADGPQITNEGKLSLSAEIITEEPRSETRYFIQDTLIGMKNFSSARLKDISLQYEDLSPYIHQEFTQFAVVDFSDEQLQANLQEWDLDLHDPDRNSFVTNITPLSAPEIGQRTLAVFILYDTLKEKLDEMISFEVRSFQNKNISQVGVWLEEQLQQKNLSLKKLCGLDEDSHIHTEASLSHDEQIEESTIVPEVEERLDEVQERSRTELRLRREGQSSETVSGFSQLRDNAIRPAFLEALQSAQELIIIYSPWMNEQVVDQEFLSLLEKRVQQGVRILIGYGISRDENREDRPVPPELLLRLHNILTPQGTPGVIAAWLGNSHAKEVVVDRKLHFSGSHNWLSYRGDRFPRGETVYQVTVPSEVEKAYEYLSQRFVQNAESLWKITHDEECRLALCILAALGLEQQALEWIRERRSFEYIALYLKLLRQGISSAERAEQLMKPLQALLTVCSDTPIVPQDGLWSEISIEFQKLFQRLGRKDYKLLERVMKEHSSELKQLELEKEIENIYASQRSNQQKKRQDAQSATKHRSYMRDGSVRKR